MARMAHLLWVLLLAGSAAAQEARLALLDSPAVPHAAASTALAPERQALKELLTGSPAADLGPAAAQAPIRRALRAWYGQRDWRPAWCAHGSPLPRARVLLEHLQRAPDHALNPDALGLSGLRTLFDLLPPQLAPEAAARLELRLSAALLAYARALSGVGGEPAAGRGLWLLQPQHPNLTGLAEHLIGAVDFAAALDGLAPSHPEYRHLQQALRFHRALAAAGGWPVLSAQAPLAPGARGEAVAHLVLRLRISGDYPPDATPTISYDDALVQAVRRFQRRHGLPADGRVGARTLAALNVPAAERARQIARSLRRWHMLPRHLGERYVLVNIPQFRLQVFEGERAALAMDVIVGDPATPTPVLSDRIDYLVLNPYWYVPIGVAERELLPRALADPGYLAAHGFELLDAERALPLPEGTVDWSGLSPEHFPYRLRQRPGPKNALGRVKFALDNPYAIYLHDTPAERLFQHARRDLSHGCVRLAQPGALVRYLSGVSPEPSDGRTRQVRLPEPVPVYLVYHTVAVDADGAVHFLPDIYGHDAAG